MNAIAVTIFHRIADPDVFDAWVGEVRSAAEVTPGFVAFAASIRRSAPLDWAIAVTFESENLLHEWLDGATWKTLVRRGAERGLLRLCADLVIVGGAVLPTGVGIVASNVSDGMEADFHAAHGRLTMAASEFSGYEGTAVFPPGASGEWMSLIRFRTEPQLSAWLGSPQRKEVLPPVRSSLTQDFSVFAQTTPLGTTVRRVNGKTAMTPSWKTAMLLLMVLYPMVMLQSRFVAPLFGKLGAERWLSVWLGQVVNVALMQWWLMPTVSSWCRRWLDPVDGAGLRISLRGAAVAVIVYAASLTVFATVEWLQYYN
ncbi:MAG TPA: antibiotic biosynthesis monooxygenase [Mycobacterium sp.]|nr:antibiotic biosynthesis monooxygenase [Mycobacterium sp.]HUH69768.1 antibiotic biosynthesis monooxygenase [Mycobacterium sp.]